MRWLALILVVACAGACGAAQHASSMHLAISELRLYEGDELVVHLLADGTLQVLEKGSNAGTQYEEWKTIGTLHPDGSLMSIQGQTVRPPEGLHFDGDALVVHDRRLALTDTGAVLLDGKPLGTDKLVHFEGVTAPAARRTALVLIALTLNR
ncbi:MAG: hypothetical protein ACM31C_01370 [Acidobacteriota bacterium]